MKKLLFCILTLSLILASLVGCGGAKDNNTALEGYYTKGDEGYFLTSYGAVKVTDGEALCVSYGANGDTVTVDGVDLTASELTKASFTAPADGGDYFVIEGKKLTGLTEAGKAQTLLFLPKGVTSVEAGAFKGSSVKALVIGSFTGSVNLANGSLEGLTALYVDGSVTPNGLTCGKNLLDGASSLQIKVGSAAYDDFKNHYNWGTFSDNIKKY